MADTVNDMKLHNGKEVFYTFKNGEKQGDNNSVDYFSRQLCVMCEVKGTNTNMFLCACMYGSTILTRIQHSDLILAPDFQVLCLYTNRLLW